MNKIKTICCMFFVSSILFAQIDFSAGMGISFVSNPSLQDYINSNFPSSDNLSSFNSLLDLYVEVDYSVNQKYQVGLEYNYSVFSYTATFGGIGQYELNYLHHKPSALVYYVLNGYGYKFKFGGGLGLRMIDLDEKIGLVNNYNSIGWGLVLKAQGFTALSEDFFANIGLSFRYDFAGKPDRNGKMIFNNSLNKNVNINSLGVGINLGISYFL